MTIRLGEFAATIQDLLREHGPDIRVVIVDQAAGAHEPASDICIKPSKSREPFARESDGFPRIEIWADER